MTEIIDADIRRKPLPLISLPTAKFKNLASYIDKMKCMRISACTCNSKMHLHQAMIFEECGSKVLPLVYGQNMIRENLPIHAEHNALLKLKTRDGKKLLPINIFVLKTTLTGVIGMSKPCSHCIIIMNTFPSKIVYRIVNIYYTTCFGYIEKTNLSKLMSEDMHISKCYSMNSYKTKGFD